MLCRSLSLAIVPARAPSSISDSTASQSSTSSFSSSSQTSRLASVPSPSPSPSSSSRRASTPSLSARPRKIHCASRSAGAAAAAAAAVAMAEEVQNESGMTTLLAFLSERGRDEKEDDLAVVILHIQTACKRIAALLASPTALPLSPAEEKTLESGSSGIGRDVPKPLDIVSNNILKASLLSSGKVAALASEEDDEAAWLGDGPYVVVFDPLDGSRNIDASIPTGTIFGIYKSLPEASGSAEEKASLNVLQPGSKLVASGYALYSSATMFCLTIGRGTHCFTLDPSFGEFVLTHPNLHIPERGQIYSLNDARYFDWPAGLRRYIDDIRQGKGQYPKKYSARYICSLVADLHRTILYGGVAANPRDHLRLVYEANPLSFLVEQAGGKGSDGKRRILDINPGKLHQRLPLFLGSEKDILELEGYGDVQQVINPGYDV